MFVNLKQDYRRFLQGSVIDMIIAGVLLLVVLAVYWLVDYIRAVIDRLFSTVFLVLSAVLFFDCFGHLCFLCYHRWLFCVKATVYLSVNILTARKDCRQYIKRAPLYRVPGKWCSCILPAADNSADLSRNPLEKNSGSLYNQGKARIRRTPGREILYEQ